MNVLLSIKPKYVEKILDGIKMYEFRKVIPKEPVKEVFIYSTCPVKRIIGKFRVGEILEDHPSKLWEQVANFSGLEEDEFFKYFEGKQRGYAIKIEDIYTFRQPIDPWKINSDFIAPQSFQYVEDSSIYL